MTLYAVNYSFDRLSEMLKVSMATAVSMIVCVRRVCDGLRWAARLR